MAQSLEGEIWKPIINYEGLYEVSNLGRVKTLTKPGFSFKPRLLRQRDNGFGYMQCQLMKNGKRNMMTVHRLVAQAFVPNPENKPQINHKDGDKRNNAVDNLEWCTNSENQIHKFRVLGIKSKGGRPKRKIICCETAIVYESAYDASNATGIHRGSISSVANHRCGYKTAGGLHWEFVV